MKIPRDLSGDDLAEVLVPFGHRVTRQAGSHMRLTTALNGEHRVTFLGTIRCVSARRPACTRTFPLTSG